MCKVCVLSTSYSSDKEKILSGLLFLPANRGCRDGRRPINIGDLSYLRQCTFSFCGQKIGLLLSFCPLQEAMSPGLCAPSEEVCSLLFIFGPVSGNLKNFLFVH